MTAFLGRRRFVCTLIRRAGSEIAEGPMDDYPGPGSNAHRKTPSPTPLCERCGKHEVEPMIVKAHAIWWWCRRCGHVWGEATSEAKSPPRNP